MFFRKSMFTAMAIMVVTIAFSASARADTVFVVGVESGGASTATVTCTFNAQTNTFTFTVMNTSPSTSTITGIGFDLVPGDFDASGGGSAGLNGFTGSQAPSLSSSFTFSDAALGNVPHGFADTVVLDFGFITGSNFAGGQTNLGLITGEIAAFTVSGAAFAGLTEEEICNAIFVRFQDVPLTAGGEGSDVGVPGDTNPIPEPTTMLLLGTGLLGIAARLRRRRRAARK